MTRCIYVIAAEGRTGKSIVGLGLIDLLTRQVQSVGVFRPLVKSAQTDEIASVLLSQPGITQTFEEAIGVTYSDVNRNTDAALSTLVSKFGAIADRFDAVVCLGSDFADSPLPTEFTFNARVAANLNASVVMTVSGRERTPQEVVDIVDNSLEELRRQHNQVVAVIAQRVDPDQVDATAAALSQAFGDLVTAALPEHRVLAAPKVGELFRQVGAEIIRGSDENLERESVGVLVCGMTLRNVLPRLFQDVTLVVPADRDDLLPGLIMAHQSGTYPAAAAMILVGGYDIPDSIQKLIAGVSDDLPIARTKAGTYGASTQLFSVEGVMTNSPRKVEIARRIFAERVDEEALIRALNVQRSDIRTPLMFEYQLMQQARKDRRTIVLPEATDDRILESAAILLQRGVAHIILLGDQTRIQARAAALGIDLTRARVVSPQDPELVERFAAEYAKLRAHKGVTLEQAREKLTDLSYFGTMMVHLGLADGMVSGAVNTTANTIRPSLEFVKTKPGVKIVSSSFLMCMPDRVLVYADCAVNPDPTAEQLADIALSSVETAKIFGVDPRVAMLSYSTGSSGSGADVEKVREATAIVRERDPDLAIEGPIQYDAAVDAEVARTKLPDSQVAGKATVFIFPDLNTGNNTYKAVQRSSGALAIGPVLQGLNKPVNDLSRGALVDDIVNTVAITAIQAQGAK